MIPFILNPSWIWENCFLLSFLGGSWFLYSSLIWAPCWLATATWQTEEEWTTHSYNCMTDIKIASSHHDPSSNWSKKDSNANCAAEFLCVKLWWLLQQSLSLTLLCVYHFKNILLGSKKPTSTGPTLPTSNLAKAKGEQKTSLAVVLRGFAWKS